MKGTVCAPIEDLPGCRKCCRLGGGKARSQGWKQPCLEWLRAVLLPRGRAVVSVFYLTVICDLYAETDCFPQLTGLPAGLLTCSGYFQPMNLLMKMAFT